MATRDDYLKYFGHAPIQGFHSGIPEHLLSPMYSPDMSNVLVEDGLLKDRPGYNELLAGFPDAVPIMEGLEWGDSSGNLHFIVVSTMGLTEYFMGTWTTRYGALPWTVGPEAPVFITPVGALSTDLLFFTNGKNQMRQWSGSGNWTVMTFNDGFTASTLLAGCMIGYRGWLILGDTTENGVNYPYRIRWCKQGDPTRWDTSAHTTAGFLNLIEDKNNSRVMTFLPMKQALVVYKFGAIYTLSYLINRNTFQPYMVKASRGTISRKGVAPVDNGDIHLVVSNDNIYLFDGFDFDKPPVGDRIYKTFFNELNWEKRGMIFAQSFPHRQEVWIMYPTGNSTVCNKAWCWNWKDNTWTPHEFADDSYCFINVQEFFSDRKALMGIEGNIMELFQGNTDNGTGIDSHWRTPLRDFSDMEGVPKDKRKMIYRVDMDASESPSIQIGSVETSLRDTISYDSAQTLATDEHGTGIRKTTHKKLGKRLTMKVSNSSQSNRGTYGEYLIYFKPEGSE
jgi:hypothetical protein